MQKRLILSNFCDWVFFTQWLNWKYIFINITTFQNLLRNLFDYRFVQWGLLLIRLALLIFCIHFIQYIIWCYLFKILVGGEDLIDSIQSVRLLLNIYLLLENIRIIVNIFQWVSPQRIFENYIIQRLKFSIIRIMR